MPYIMIPWIYSCSSRDKYSKSWWCGSNVNWILSS